VSYVYVIYVYVSSHTIFCRKQICPKRPPRKIINAIKKCIHVYTYVYMYVYMYIHIHKYTYIYIQRYIHTCIHIYLHTYIHVYIDTYIHTYIHIYIHAYIHPYMYTYIHTYTYKSMWLVYTCRLTLSFFFSFSTGNNTILDYLPPWELTPESARRRPIRKGAVECENWVKKDLYESKETYRRDLQKGPAKKTYWLSRRVCSAEARYTVECQDDIKENCIHEKRHMNKSSHRL